MQSSREYTRIPLAIPTIALIAGIVLFRHIPSIIPFASALAIAVMAAITAAFMRTPPRMAMPLILAIVFFGLGGTSAYLSAPYDAAKLNRAKSLQGTVQQCIMTASGYRLTVDVELAHLDDGSTTKPYNLKILLLTDGNTTHAGDIIRFPASLTDAANLPIFEAEKYARALLTKGIKYSCYAKQEEVDVVGKSKSLTAIAARMRDNVVELISSSSLRPAAKAFATAIITADRSLITNDTITQFSQAGIAHILALSGLHIGIIAVLATSLLLPLNLVFPFKSRYIAIILLLWLFAAFTGFTPPTTRACVMATIFYIELLLERPHSAFNSLCAAILVIAIATPDAVFDPGFQLSITCVGSIILLTRRLNPIRQHEHPTLHSAVGIVVASIIASLGSWIITGFYFRNIPFANVPANMIAIPLIAPFLTLSIIHTILLAVGIELKALNFILDNAYELLEKLAGSMAIDAHFSPSADAAILWTMAIIFLGIAIHWNRKGGLKYLPAATAAISATAIAVIAPEIREEGIIISLNKGSVEVSYRLPTQEGNEAFGRGITSFAQFGTCKCTILQKPIDRLDSNRRAMLANSDLIILAGAFKGDVNQLIETTRKRNPIIIIGPYLRRHVRDELTSSLLARDIPHAILTHEHHIRHTNISPFLPLTYP